MSPPASGELVFEEPDSCTSAPTPAPAAVWMMVEETDEIGAALDGVSAAAEGLVGLPPHAETTEAARRTAAIEQPERNDRVMCLMLRETAGEARRNGKSARGRMPQELVSGPRATAHDCAYGRGSEYRRHA